MKHSMDHHRPETLEELKLRFASKFAGYSKKDCCEYIDGKLNDGYGAFSVKNRTYGAHRIAWVFANHLELATVDEVITCLRGDGRFVCHRCNNPPCCNPAHLTRATPKQNSEYMVACGRAATGIRNGKYTKPECTPRGNNSPAVLHPELYRGELNGQAKLNSAKVLKIRELCASGKYSQQQIADKFGIAQNHVSKIHLRQMWGHI